MGGKAEMNTPTSVGFLMAGTIATAVGLHGYFNPRIQYCDHRTSPCTPVVVVHDWQLPKTAAAAELLPGTGGWRTLGALAGTAFFIVGHLAAQRAEKHQEGLEAGQAQQDLLEASRLETLTNEEQQKLAIAADLRVRSFERDIKEASALLYLQGHPELLEAIAPKKPSESPPEVQPPETIEEPAAPELSPEEKLTQLIQEHEGGWISQLMKKPVLIYGDMGGFKSYFGSFLALTRYYLHGYKIVSICDPHFHQNKNEAWKYLSKLGVVGYGTHQDYSEVSDCINLMYERFANRTQKDDWITSIWDEVTNYNLYKECQDAASIFLRKILTDPRKAHEAPIIIAHDDTLEVLGGSEGISRRKDRGGLIKLELYSDSENQPLFKGNLTGIKDGDGLMIQGLEVSIKPDWIRPEFVYNLFNAEAKVRSKDEEASKQKQSDFKEQVRLFLEDCWEVNTDDTSLRPAGDSYPQSPAVSNESPGVYPLHANDSSNSRDQSLTYKKVKDLYPNSTPESLYQSLETAASEGQTASQIIKQVFKCVKDNSHPTRSYNLVGKPLFKWLIQNFGDKTLVDQFRDFLNQN
jgi:hypothetical protein